MSHYVLESANGWYLGRAVADPISRPMSPHRSGAQVFATRADANAVARALGGDLEVVQVDDEPKDTNPGAAEAPPAFDVLSARERQVALLLAVGHNHREIADTLGGVSTKTIDTHRGRVLVKLGCRSNTDLARAALRAGLVTLDPRPGELLGR